MGKRKHDAELVQVAEAVVIALRDPSYRPTLLNPAAANAFDSAMSLASRPTRAWRGSNGSARRAFHRLSGEGC